MSKFLLCALNLALLATAAQAATLSLKLNNKTGVAINSISAAPKLGGATLSLIAAPVAAATQQMITVTPAGADCVFTLTYTLATGKKIIVPDTDICQADQIIVQ